MKNMNCNSFIKKHKPAVLLTLTVLFILNAGVLTAVSPGLRLAFGGRYDNVRMCVATPAGVPGGPAGSASLFLVFRDGLDGYLDFNLPVFRPLLFWLRFEMLQFEPEFTWIPHPEDTWSWGMGLGVILHYGPDYNSDSDNRGTEFWALGPKLSFLVRRKIHASLFRARHSIGLRPYISPLFSPDYSTGIVLGINLEYSLLW